jgi:drug/metabolite transporter (DMT)-like permease
MSRPRRWLTAYLLFMGASAVLNAVLFVREGETISAVATALCALAGVLCWAGTR